MLDIRWIRDHADEFDRGLARRGAPPMAATLIDLDQTRRTALADAQDLQARRKALAKEIGARKARGDDAEALLAEVGRSKQDEAALEDRARAAEAALSERLALIPNLPAAEVPDGVDERDNVELRRWGEPRSFEFPVRDHVDIGEALGMMDFERASKLSGSRFVVLKGMLARLERALAQFMLDVHTETFGYEEISPPALVRDEVLFGTGNLPKFGDDLFHTTDGRWLIPTAEVPLTNLAAGDILAESDLPRRYTALTWCFRAEAGASGKDTRGMIRQHQFLKVELVSLTTAERSEDEHERMTGCAETILQRLELPYRVVVLCAGDMGFAARKTYDLEVWLPGQRRYREISSCSNCGDFQARRMQARYRPNGEKGTRWLHTLNGSGLAVGRALVAVLENYQQADGSVAVPSVLRSYMGNRECIAGHASSSD